MPRQHVDVFHKMQEGNEAGTTYQIVKPVKWQVVYISVPGTVTRATAAVSPKMAIPDGLSQTTTIARLALCMLPLWRQHSCSGT